MLTRPERLCQKHMNPDLQSANPQDFQSLFLAMFHTNSNDDLNILYNQFLATLASSNASRRKAFAVCGPPKTYKTVLLTIVDRAFKLLEKCTQHVTLEFNMKFSLSYLNKVDLLDELSPDLLTEANHNSLSAILGGIYSGSPPCKGKESNFVSFNCPTITTSNYKISYLLCKSNQEFSVFFRRKHLTLFSLTMMK